MTQPQPVAITVQKLEERATKLRELIDATAHPAVSLSLQRTYGSLRGCAELASLLENAASTYVDTTLASTKTDPQAARTIGAIATVQDTVIEFRHLLLSGDLISNGRDAEAIKALGRHVFDLILKIGAKLSGVEYIKDLAELIAALKDLIKTGQIIKFRKQQVRTASDLLKWADAVTLVALAWAYSAQRYLLVTEGKTGAELEDEAVLELVIARMVQCSQTWHPNL